MLLGELIEFSPSRFSGCRHMLGPAVVSCEDLFSTQAEEFVFSWVRLEEGVEAFHNVVCFGVLGSVDKLRITVYVVSWFEELGDYVFMVCHHDLLEETGIEWFDIGAPFVLELVDEESREEVCGHVVF